MAERFGPARCLPGLGKMCGLYEGDCQLIMSFGAVWGGISGLLEIADRRLSALGAQIDLAQFEPALGVHGRSEEHTSELQSRLHLVCRLLLEKKKKTTQTIAETS